MSVVERVAKVCELFAEGVGGVGVVMEMDVDVPVAAAAEFGELVEVFGAVFVLRKKNECCGGAVDVLEAVEEFWVLTDPAGNASAPGTRCAVAFGFVVVADGDEDFAGGVSASVRRDGAEWM
ncbi:MAG: hypothetical protein U0992_12500 [Planctomycetaceae bacterium]